MARSGTAVLLSAGSVHVAGIRGAIAAAGLAVRQVRPGEERRVAGIVARLVVVDAGVSGADALQLLMQLHPPPGRDLPPTLYLLGAASDWQPSGAADERGLPASANLIDLARAIVELIDPPRTDDPLAGLEHTAPTAPQGSLLDPVTYAPRAGRVRVRPIAGGERRLAAAAAAFLTSLTILA